MSKYTPIITVAVLLLVALGVIFFAVRSSNSGQQVSQAGVPTPAGPSVPGQQPQQKPPGMTIEGAGLEQRDPQGRLEWKVTAAGDLEFDTGKQTVSGRDVEFEMLSQDRLPVIVLAPVLDANYDTKQLTFSQGVRGHLKDGSAHFQVNHLVYDFATKKLVGSGGAKLVQGQNTATAQEIVLDAVTKKVRLRGGVRFEHRG